MSERERFEEWYEADAMPLEADWFKKDGDGDYILDNTACSWRAWRVAVAAERERCAGTLWHCDACGTLTDTRECDCTRQGAANCLRPFTLADVQTVVAAERERCVLLLERCHTVLANMAKENEGAIFNRWPINHEPLRADARSILPDLEAAIRKGE